jgi:Fe2+ transport system protein FeoA
MGSPLLVESVRDIQPQLQRKLLAMGVVAGREIYVTRRALFGDPIAISVCDSLLSLRLHEAASVHVSCDSALMFEEEKLF